MDISNKSNVRFESIVARTSVSTDVVRTNSSMAASDVTFTHFIGELLLALIEIKTSESYLMPAPVQDRYQTKHSDNWYIIPFPQQFFSRFTLFKLSKSSSKSFWRHYESLIMIWRSPLSSGLLVLVGPFSVGWSEKGFGIMLSRDTEVCGKSAKL